MNQHKTDSKCKKCNIILIKETQIKKNNLNSDTVDMTVHLTVLQIIFFLGLSLFTEVLFR